MGSPYDILIDIRAKAEEVAAATAAITELVKQAEATGPALVAGIQKGDAATRALGNDIKEVAAAAGATGKAGGAAGAATADGMDKAGKSAKSAAKAVKDVGDAADEAGKHAGSLRELFEQAFAFGIGNQIVERVLEIPTRLLEGFSEAIHKGVEFNAEMESLGVSLAASLRQSAPEKYLNFAEARVAATQAIEQIQQKANALGLDFKAVGETLSVSMKALADGGIRDINQQIEVTTLLMQAASAKNVSGTQAVRDIIDILNGRGDRVVLSKELGISNEDIKSAEQAGTLYDLLTSKLSAYKEAGEAAANTFNGLWQSVRTLFAQLEGSAAAPVFEELKSDLVKIKGLLDDVTAKGTAKGTANILGGVIDGLKEVYAWCQKFASLPPELSLLLHGGAALAGHPFDTGTYAAQLEANQKIVSDLQQQAREATTQQQADAVRLALTNAIAEAQQKVSTSQGDQKTAAELLLTSLQSVEHSFDTSAQHAHNAAGETENMHGGLERSNAELEKMLEKLPSIVDGLNKAAQAADFALKLANAIGPAAKIGVYQGQQASLLADINKAATDAGGLGGITSSLGARGEATRLADDKVPQTEAQAAAVVRLTQLTNELLKTESGITSEQRNQTSETEKQNFEELKRRMLHSESTASSRDELQAREDALKVAERERALINGPDHMDPAKAHETALQEVEDQRQIAALKKQFNAEDKAGRKAGADATKEQHQVDLAADKDRKTALLEIRDQIQEIQKDPFLTNAEKERGEKPLLEQELALIEQNIAARQKLIALYGNDPKHAQEVARLKQENVQDAHQGSDARTQLKGASFVGDLKKQTTDLENQWGTVSHSIATDITSTIGTAVDGLSNAISGLITGTKTWGQALTQVGESIIQMLIRIVLQQTIGRALVYAVNLAYTSAEAATSSAAASTAASSWATAAVLASVATYGVAAGAGLAALTAAVASGEAIAVAGSAVGGAGGFAEGGLIPGRPSTKDNRIAHVATGEYIVRTAAVQHYGPDFFHALNSMQVARNGFATGGLVGAGDGYAPVFATSNPSVKVGGHQVTLVQVRDRNEMLQALQSSEGRKIILGHVTGNRTKVGIRT